MGRSVISVLSCLVLLSCSYLGPVELNRPIRDVVHHGSNAGGSGSEGEDIPAAPVTKKALYITGVEYPGDYDWRQASGYNDVGGKLFLMKDDSRVLELDIGARQCISSDADMHRCVGGHLYTDFSTETETVVRKDGEEIFRYSGREMIAGIIESDGFVYTLGQPRSGGGWTYRRNGVTLLQKPSGRLVTGLLEDAGMMYFVYEEKEASSYRYILVENGVQTVIPLPSGITSIDDARLVDGTLWQISVAGSSASRMLYCGSVKKTFSVPAGSKLLSGRFLSGGKDGLLVAGEVQTGGSVQNWLWKDNALLCKINSPLALLGGGAEWPSYFYVSGLAELGGGATVYDGTKTFNLPDYDCLYGNACGIYEGNIYAGLIDRSSGNRPVLWKGGVVIPYDFNGYFTSISYW